MISYNEVTGTGKNRINFSEVTIEAATRYAAEDADVTWLLHEKLLPMVREQGLEELFTDLEMPLMEILTRMERYGVLLDCGFLKQLSDDFGHQMALLEERIHEMAETPLTSTPPNSWGRYSLKSLVWPLVKRPRVRPPGPPITRCCPDWPKSMR